MNRRLAKVGFKDVWSFARGYTTGQQHVNPGRKSWCSVVEHPFWSRLSVQLSLGLFWSVTLLVLTLKVSQQNPKCILSPHKAAVRLSILGGQRG